MKGIDAARQELAEAEGSIFLLAFFTPYATVSVSLSLSLSVCVCVCVSSASAADRTGEGVRIHVWHSVFSSVREGNRETYVGITMYAVWSFLVCSSYQTMRADREHIIMQVDLVVIRHISVIGRYGNKWFCCLTSATVDSRTQLLKKLRWGNK